MSKSIRDAAQALLDEGRDLLNETYKFAATSPRSQENINGVCDLLDALQAALAAPEPTAADLTDKQIIAIRKGTVAANHAPWADTLTFARAIIAAMEAMRNQIADLQRSSDTYFAERNSARDAYSKAWPEAMAGPSAGLPALLAASRSAVARMREVDAVLGRGGQPLLGHTLHMPALLLETAAKEVNLGAVEWSRPGELDWSEV